MFRSRKQQPPPVADYIYVSRTKVERLSASLSDNALKRLKSIDLKVGPVGAGISLGDAPNPHVIKVAEAVDDALRKSYKIHDPFSGDLASGHYIGGTLKMVYGVHDAPSDDTSSYHLHLRAALTPKGAAPKQMTERAAVFYSRKGNDSLCLVGSASHMLDRVDSSIDVSPRLMSAPDTIYGFLAGLSEDYGEAEDIGLLVEANMPRVRLGYPVDALEAVLKEKTGLFPLSFLARVYRITFEGPRDEERYIVGSPIWVKSEVPA